MVVFSTIFLRRAAAASAVVAINNRAIRTITQRRSYRSSAIFSTLPKKKESVLEEELNRPRMQQHTPDDESLLLAIKSDKIIYDDDDHHPIEVQSILEELNRGGRNFTYDDSLRFAIESEIDSYRFSDIRRGVEVEAPTAFPFKIEDNPGEVTITLTRDYQGGEVIKVTVHMPDEDGEKKNGGGQSSIPLVVYVSKDGGGPNLEFSVMAYPDEISIHNLSVKKEPNADASEHHQTYRDLNENLQKAFHKSYLEIRGIKPSTTNFLREYMINKKSRENLTWLNDMKEFVSS